MKRARGPAVVLVLMLGLAGCSGGSNPAPVALPTLGTATPTGNRPTSVRTDLPEAATERTPAGGAAFVRYFYAQASSAFRSADASKLDGMSAEQCGTCASYMASAKQLKADGQVVDGIAFRVLSAESPAEQDGYLAVDVVIDAPARILRSADGRPLERLASDPQYEVIVYLQWSSNHWLVRAVKNAKQ